jgi:hypothetical protein
LFEGVEDPEEGDAFAGVDGAFAAVDVGGGRGDDFTDPVGREGDGVFGESGESFAAPAHDVGDEDVGARWISGAQKVHQPPGPPRPKQKGGPSVKLR